MEPQALKIGMQAPNPTVYTADEQQRTFDVYWRKQPTLFFFLRHFGCALCRQHLMQIRDAYPAIRGLGGEVVAVTFADPQNTAIFARRMQIPFPSLSDETRRSYRMFGLTQGSFSDTASFAVLARQLQQGLRGNIPYVTPNTDIAQLGGAFVVGTDGRLLLAHVGLPIYVYPTNDQYLAAFAAARKGIASTS